jgi:hypothetical protein
MPLLDTQGSDSADAYGGGAAAKIKYIENYFQTWLRTGTGSSATVTTGLDASTNKALVWTKSRSSGYDHKLTDTVRGATKALISDTSGVQTTDTNGLTAFSATGYTIGSDYNYNDSGTTYVDWEFVATSKFFDIVTFTTDVIGYALVNHNLGSTPGCVIVKATGELADWSVFHKDLNGGTNPNRYQLKLNKTAAQSNPTGANDWIVPTSTTLTFPSGMWLIGNSTYVAYIFASNAGGFGLTGTDNVISCGSFTAGASGFGPVNLGYEPQYILFKNTNNTQNWVVWDIMRGMSLTTGVSLNPNLSSAEGAWGASSYVFPTATGFQGTGDFFGNGSNVIYIAIRRGPMKVPTVGTSVFSPNNFTPPSSPNTITTNFPVDLAMFMDRNGNSGYGDIFVDRLRGSSSSASSYLQSSSTNAEARSSGRGIALDNNTGYQEDLSFSWFGDQTSTIFWNMRRAPSFFDEVCYTGDSTNSRAISHNLTVTPELWIIKSRSNVVDWQVYSSYIASNQRLRLNSTAAADVNVVSSASSTTFTVNYSGADSINQSGYTYVAYLFATCAGVSKVGSYTGTGATQSISCGFTGGARFVLIKRTDSTGNWETFDSARGMTSGTDPHLELNTTNAETNANWVYTTTGGFQIVTSDANVNANGGSYIFLAIA